MSVGRIPKKTTPAMPGLTATVAELNYCGSVSSAIQTQIDTKAPTASPNLTGTPLAPDHGTAATDMLVNCCYGTGAAPSASSTTIGSLYIKYVA